MDVTINTLSALSAILTFFWFVIQKRMKGKEVILSDLVITIICGGMLPLAISLVLYPFFPDLISSIENVSLQIALMGLILVFVYFKTILEKIRG